ncbi:MAG: hypothetical protein RSB70_03660 [Clostridium sp.]
MEVELDFPDDLVEFRKTVTSAFAKACYLEFSEEESWAIVEALEKQIG